MILTMITKLNILVLRIMQWFELKLLNILHNWGEYSEVKINSDQLWKPKTESGNQSINILIILIQPSQRQVGVTWSGVLTQG